MIMGWRKRVAIVKPSAAETYGKSHDPPPAAKNVGWKNIYRLRSTGEAEPAGAGCENMQVTCAAAFDRKSGLYICGGYPAPSCIAWQYRTKQNSTSLARFSRLGIEQKNDACKRYYMRDDLQERNYNFVICGMIDTIHTLPKTPDWPYPATFQTPSN